MQSSRKRKPRPQQATAGATKGKPSDINYLRDHERGAQPAINYIPRKWPCRPRPIMATMSSDREPTVSQPIDWEQRRKRPSGAARALLRLIEQKPELLECLAGSNNTAGNEIATR
jgi:hypothetical protein